MKEKVLAILNSDQSDSEKFNALFSIYRNTQGRNESLVRYFNLQGFKKDTFDDLVYQIKKLVGVSDFDVATFERKDVEAKTKHIVSEIDIANNPELTDQGISTGDEIEFNTHDDKDDETGGEEDNGKKDPVSFREEYPFFNNPDVPEEFKILASDKITAFKILQKGHEILLAAGNGESDLSEEELAVLATEVAEADELNALIKEEFDHYQETGEILGKHRIFSERNLVKKIEQMTGEDKSKRITNLGTYIRRDKKKLAEQTDPTEIEKWAKKVDEWELELKLIQKSM